MLQYLRRLLTCFTQRANEPAPTAFETAYQVLQEQFEKLTLSDDAGLLQQYESLQEVEGSESTDAAETLGNCCKNRYTDVVPYDYNRVKLSGNSDYINASLLQSTGSEQPSWSYIATQGPLQSTTKDFWNMIFANKVSAVVMLTRNIEDNHVKCAHYFNQEAGQPSNYGHYTVTTAQVKEVSQDITERLILVYNCQTEETHQVTHYHYHGWPDYGVPTTTSAVRLLCNLLWMTNSTRSHVVVHCSAGIGRTGAFIAIDIVLRRILELAQSPQHSKSEIEDAVDLRSVVLSLRQQRRGMVQTLEQYRFCFEAVLEEMESRSKLPLAAP